MSPSLPSTVGPPHVQSPLDVKRYLILVLIALTPIVLFSIFLFETRALLIIGVSYFFGLGTEWVYCRVFKKQINEGALISCLLYALILPPTLPLWMVALGIVVAMLIGKALFGGLGRNVLNPALVGRCFLHIAFPVHMTQQWVSPGQTLITHATPVVQFKTAGESVSLIDLFIGNVAGCLGETSSILILLGGLFLLAFKIARWQIVVSTLCGALISIFLLGEKAQAMLPALLSGGFLFGTFFMATDPVTASHTRKACWVYGFGIGLLAMWIRYSSNYNEGIMFAILMMNVCAPFLDTVMIRLVYKLKYRHVH